HFRCVRCRRTMKMGSSRRGISSFRGSGESPGLVSSFPAGSTTAAGSGDAWSYLSGESLCLALSTASSRLSLALAILVLMVAPFWSRFPSRLRSLSPLRALAASLARPFQSSVFAPMGKSFRWRSSGQESVSSFTPGWALRARLQARWRGVSLDLPVAGVGDRVEREPDQAGSHDREQDRSVGETRHFAESSVKADRRARVVAD